MEFDKLVISLIPLSMNMRIIAFFTTCVDRNYFGLCRLGLTGEASLSLQIFGGVCTVILDYDSLG